MVGKNQVGLFQPPFHPLLQATEDVWGFVKNYVRRNREEFTNAEVVKRVAETFEDAAVRNFWADAVRHCKEEEAHLRLKYDLEMVPLTLLPKERRLQPVLENGRVIFV